MKKKLFVISVLLLTVILFSFIDEKKTKSESSVALFANRSMWNNLHLGNYDSIPAILSTLNYAYSEDPKNIKITAHLGFIYLWAFSERGRKKTDSTILENVYLSNRFFKEAIRLDPYDPRLRGFQSALDICQGAVSEKKILLLKGYLDGLKAIRKWPQFNRSALSFMESQLDTSSRMFHQGIKYQWMLIDECSCKKLDKETILQAPHKVLKDLVDELKQSTDPKIKRACWNSWIAPHNLEGFFLNFGDMLVKEGHLSEAKEIYAAAKLSPSYSQWPYKSVLEERMRDMKSNEKIFNQQLKIITKKGERQIFINSKISCVACHQMSKSEFKKQGYQEPADDIYFMK